MIPRIAIPLPTSSNWEYNHRNWGSYAEALRLSGAEAVEFPLDLTPRAIAELANTCHAVLLPGSPADVNPGKYGQEVEACTALPDLPRENVDELLLQDAHNLHKPLLCICFGAEILNVWRGGTLLQDLSVLPVNHAATRAVLTAHTVSVAPGSLLEKVLGGAYQNLSETSERVAVNSSHHQAIGIPGDGLRISARCPQDGVIEAVEGGQNSAIDGHNSHFVLGLQWHPERTYNESTSSRAIFSGFVAAAAAWSPRAILTSVVR